MDIWPTLLCKRRIKKKNLKTSKILILKSIYYYKITVYKFKAEAVYQYIWYGYFFIYCVHNMYFIVIIRIR
ncbi:hypothetical protein GCM10008022_40770 [Paenibacillus hunanensis]|nr:hypothetical protein GCM10008022_40770 [Paenibacillus hunanensis]